MKNAKLNEEFPSAENTDRSDFNQKDLGVSSKWTVEEATVIKPNAMDMYKRYMIDGKLKPRGLQQILSDAGTFTSDDIRMAARLAILESVKKTGQVITMRDVEGICDSVTKTILKNKTK